MFAKIYDFGPAIELLNQQWNRWSEDQRDTLAQQQVDAAIEQFRKDMDILKLPYPFEEPAYLEVFYDFMMDPANGLDARIAPCYMQAYLSLQQNGTLRMVAKDLKAREQEAIEVARKADNPRARLDRLMGRGETPIRKIEGNKTVIDGDTEKLSRDDINNLKSLSLKELRQKAVASIRANNTERRQVQIDKGLETY